MPLNPGENPNWQYEEYNIAQLGKVTEPDGLGGFRLKTSGSASGGGSGTVVASNSALNQPITNAPFNMFTYTVGASDEQLYAAAYLNFTSEGVGVNNTVVCFMDYTDENGVAQTTLLAGVQNGVVATGFTSAAYPVTFFQTMITAKAGTGVVIGFVRGAGSRPKSADMYAQLILPSAGSGAGLATEVKQDAQIAELLDIVTATQSTDTHTGVIETQTTNSANSLANIESLNSTMEGELNNIQGNTLAVITPINNTDVSTKVLSQSKLLINESSPWNTTNSVTIPDSLIIAIYDVNGKAFLNPYDLSAGAFALVKPAEKYCMLNGASSNVIANYWNAILTGAPRTFTAFDAPGVTDFIIFYCQPSP